jgi:energy-coupling factor transporter ATP-binding protein EcfA2
MYTYKLTSVGLNNGLKISPGNLTVIIGPNNAGKSRALKDIAWTTTKETLSQRIIVNDVEWTLPQNFQELREAYNLKRYQDENGNWIFRALAPELHQEYHNNAQHWYNWDEQQNFLPYLNKAAFAGQFGSAMVAFLTTENRLQLVKESPSSYHEREE